VPAAPSLTGTGRFSMTLKKWRFADVFRQPQAGAGHRGLGSQP